METHQSQRMNLTFDSVELSFFVFWDSYYGDWQQWKTQLSVKSWTSEFVYYWIASHENILLARHTISPAQYNHLNSHILFNNLRVLFNLMILQVIHTPKLEHRI